MQEYFPLTRVLILIASLTAFAMQASAADTPTDSEQWVDVRGGQGPGKGKHIVLVAGANEYNPENGLPILGRILATHHGFDCTLLFTINKQTGVIDPDVVDNIPGLEALDRADLLVIQCRFRTLPDEQMKHIVDYVESGRPVIGLRTATHSFAYPDDSKSIYAKYRWNNQDPSFDGGFGRHVLGETWINHHAPNGSTSTRGRIAPDAADDPILRGIKDAEIWGTTGVYDVRLPLLPNSRTLLLGEVVAGPHPTDPAAVGKVNDPMMPVAWHRTYEIVPGKVGRAFATTMGSAADLQNEALRRMMINACYWAVGMENQIPAKTNVECVGPAMPSNRGKKPSEIQK